MSIFSYSPVLFGERMLTDYTIHQRQLIPSGASPFADLRGFQAAGPGYSADGQTHSSALSDRSDQAARLPAISSGSWSSQVYNLRLLRTLVLAFG